MASINFMCCPKLVGHVPHRPCCSYATGTGCLLLCAHVLVEVQDSSQYDVIGISPAPDVTFDAVGYASLHEVEDLYNSATPETKEFARGGGGGG